MVSHAVPPVAMAAISAYVGILFIGLYFALAGLTDAQERRDYLTFSATCLAVVVFDLGCARLYHARSFEEGVLWNRVGLCTAGFLGSTYMTFVWDFLKRPLPLPLRIARGFILLVAPLIVVWDSEYTQSSKLPSVKVVDILGHHITYYEAQNGLLTTLMFATFLVVYATASVQMLRYFWSAPGRHQRGQWGFFVGVVASGVAATNDVLVGSEVYQSIYLAEYGFTCVLLTMGYVLLMRFADLRGRINTLNRNLSNTNDELVVALGRANDSIRLKSEFLASISHELRTPLNAIINLPEGVLEQFTTNRTAVCAQCGANFALETDEKVERDASCPMCGQARLRETIEPVFEGQPDETKASMQTVVRAGKHLLALVNDLLDASKLELGRTKLHMAAFDGVELVTEVVSSVRTIARQRAITIVQEANTSEPIVLMADRVRIGQVLYNVLSNAIKFSPDGGQIEVQIDANTHAEALVICVRDHGIGIDPEHHAVVFERFRQVEGGSTRKYGGTGLGLAISKDLVELHLGKIWVESRSGEGAAFFIQLPRALALPAGAANDVQLAHRQSA